MTGEMYKTDVTPEQFPVHFEIAEALGGTVEPFDVYQGPYICLGLDMRCGQEPYAIPTRGLGIVRLWIVGDFGDKIYNEHNGKLSDPFFPEDTEGAVAAARQVL